MGVGSNPTSDMDFLFSPPWPMLQHCRELVATRLWLWFKDSRVAQWKRAGPITQRSVDRNHALLNLFLLPIHAGDIGLGELGVLSNNFDTTSHLCQDGRVV